MIAAGHLEPLPAHQEDVDVGDRGDRRAGIRNRLLLGVDLVLRQCIHETVAKPYGAGLTRKNGNRMELSQTQEKCS